MAGGDGLIRLREALKADLPPAPFVGAGFSVAVTGGVAEASWIGLLKDGIRECERVVSSLPPGWGGQMRDQLENTDAINCIGIADQIVRRLREVGSGTGYDSWIQGAMGRLRPGPGGEQIIAAVRELAKARIIVTTNYDTLIEDPKPPWESVTWTDDRYKRRKCSRGSLCTCTDCPGILDRSSSAARTMNGWEPISIGSSKGPSSTR